MLLAGLLPVVLLPVLLPELFTAGREPLALKGCAATGTGEAITGLAMGGRAIAELRAGSLLATLAGLAGLTGLAGIAGGFVSLTGAPACGFTGETRGSSLSAF